MIRMPSRATPRRTSSWLMRSDVAPRDGAFAVGEGDMGVCTFDPTSLGIQGGEPNDGCHNR